MSSMFENMKKKRLKATFTTRSAEVVKRIPKCDVVELNSTLEPIISQNKRERIASEEQIADMILGK